MISFTKNNVYKAGCYLGSIEVCYGKYRFMPVAGAMICAEDLRQIANELDKRESK